MYTTCSSTLFLFLLQCIWFVWAGVDITYADYQLMMDEEEVDYQQTMDEEVVVPVDDSANDLPKYYEEPVAEAFSSSVIKNLAYRLDLVPCNTPEPNANKAYRFYAYVYYSRSRRRFRCRKRFRNSKSIHFHKNKMIITPETRSGRYYRRRIEHYHIQCPTDHHCRLNITNVDLEDRVKLGSARVCMDYIYVLDRSTNDLRERCGHEELINFPFEGSLDAVFRSGNNIQGKGFTITVCAFKNAIVTTDNCLMPNNDFSAEKYLQYATLIPSSNENLQDAIYYGDEDYVTRPRMQFIPYGSAKKLLKFYIENHRTSFANHSKSVKPTVNDGILRLAVLTEKSCDSMDSDIAQKVISVFPQSMVDQMIMKMSQEY